MAHVNASYTRNLHFFAIVQAIWDFHALSSCSRFPKVVKYLFFYKAPDLRRSPSTELGRQFSVHVSCQFREFLGYTTSQVEWLELRSVVKFLRNHSSSTLKDCCAWWHLSLTSGCYKEVLLQYLQKTLKDGSLHNLLYVYYPWSHWLYYEKSVCIHVGVQTLWNPERWTMTFEGLITVTIMWRGTDHARDIKSGPAAKIFDCWSSVDSEMIIQKPGTSLVTRNLQFAFLSTIVIIGTSSSPHRK